MYCVLPFRGSVKSFLFSPSLNNLELALHIIAFPSHLILYPMSTELFDKVP